MGLDPSGFVHAEHERRGRFELAGHLAAEGKDFVLDVQRHFRASGGEVEFGDVDPDHVGGVGALEVVAAAGQVLHGPEDRAGDVRSVRVAQAGGDRNVSDVPWPGNSPQQRIRI